jgi:biotin transport system substrate-specific component
MAGLSLAIGHPTLADRLFSRGLARDLLLIAVGAAFVAIAAQVRLPLWPVALTGQTLAVLLAGAFLGALRAALSLSLYVVLGVLGLPVFADGDSGLDAMTGSMGGFLVGFVAAAALVGWVAQRAWDHRLVGAVLSCLAGTLVFFAFGLPWLAVVLHTGLAGALDRGLLPYAVASVVKLLMAALVIAFAWSKVRGHDARAAAADLASTRTA